MTKPTPSFCWPLIVLCCLNLSLTAQDIDAIIDAQQIDTIFYHGPKDNRINFAIQNRGVDNADSEFAGPLDLSQAIEADLLETFTPGHLRAQTPYAQYRDFFNLYAFWWPDALSDSEGWNFNIVKAVRDAYFLPWADDSHGWATLFSVTKYGGGGGAGLDRDRRVGDGKLYGTGFETLLHEFGHTMPGLLDEYSSSGEWSGGQCWETPNTTGAGRIDDVPWRRWIEPGTPIPTPYTGEYLDVIGAFEGALTNFFGCHRPTARGCFMGAGGFGEDYGQELCPPCIQRVICYLYRYVDVIENPSPAATDLTVTGPETLHFSADILKPEPNTQLYQWILNGRVIATGVEEVEVTFGPCDTYELVLAVTDTTAMVRYDEAFDHIYPKPYQERRWIINQTEVDDYGLIVEAAVINADCTGEATGSVEFGVSGGEGPYEVWLENEVVGNPVTGLSAGHYVIEIVDAVGCSLIREITVGQDPALLPSICSELVGDLWNLSLDTGPYPAEELSFLWSTGATTPALEQMPDGNYTVQVTTANGCQVEAGVGLEYVDNTLQAAATAFPTDPDEPTGRIYLDIENGRPSYSIEWTDRPNEDRTGAGAGNPVSSGMNFGHLPEYAFDDDPGTKWLHNIPADAYIGYHIPGGAIINLYAITSADDVPARDPKDWELQASHDGTSWVTLDAQQDFNFSSRFERRTFLLSNEEAYEFYRLYILENHGNSAIQLQELEFVGTNPTAEGSANPEAADRPRRTQLPAGLYEYTVKDANRTAITGSVTIGYAPAFQATGLVVEQVSDCAVGIAQPNPDYTFYWLADEEGTAILGTGTTFQPPTGGNYYVAALDNTSQAISRNARGFAVTQPAAPQVIAAGDTALTIVDPDPNLTYYWYGADECGGALHTGTVFQPTAHDYYYVAAARNTDFPDPLNPATVPGLLVRMDASDLNGDGQVDDPAPPNSSTLDWTFTNGNGWHAGSWFAYRSNHQNGLGVADFSTIWLQRIQQEEVGYQTMLMAYQENPLSFPGRAPFESLSESFPRHTDGSQLYSNSAPARTLNGTTYWNGQVVDPLATPNDFSFNVLGTVMTAPTFYPVFYTDTHWEGQLGELLLYEGPLSDAQMRGLSEYLRRKWVATADLQSARTEVFWDGLTGSEAPRRPRVHIFPNPTSGTLMIRGLQGRPFIRLLDREGRLLQGYETTSTELRLDLGNLPEGIYLVSIEDREGAWRWVEKVVVSRR